MTRPTSCVTMTCHETLTFSGKDDEVEKEEAFPLGKSDVCRAKLEVYTATGALVKVTIAPDTVSSVVMASRPLLHGLHSSNSGTITTSGGSSLLSERGYLIIPHKVRGSTIVPGFAAGKASLPDNCSVLLKVSVQTAAYRCPRTPTVTSKSHLELKNQI